MIFVVPDEKKRRNEKKEITGCYNSSGEVFVLHTAVIYLV
jgi:hypothetical protein